MCVTSNEMGVSWWERGSGKGVEGFDSVFKTGYNILEMKEPCP